ncbi:MAG: efflux RND transporter periplasmic adaptor subunit [Haliea sp.]|mgnify:FL=1|nr:efflux RND transporter periplasmic adaptor subunit [Haliea sp.]MDP5064883.1 efflux RND transporter periplasmic adaptor subunit [Haliea sp.]
MKRFIVAGLALATLAAVLWPRLQPFSATTSAGAPVNRAATAVRTQRIQPESFESRLFFNGTLAAEQSITILSELRGKVEKILFLDGQMIRAGDPIITIESAELSAELRSLEEQLTLASTQADRLQNLFGTGAVTASDRDDAISRREVLRAEAARVRARLAKTTITAPFDGTLGLRHVSTGDLIEAATLITTLQTVADLYVDFSVPERYRQQLSVGTRLSLIVSGHANPFAAVVRAIDPRIDLNTRTLTVRADVENPHSLLLPGNYARVELVTRNDAALVVPSIAVLQNLEAVTVFTVEDGIAVSHEVKTGYRDARRVEILSGLEPGMEVITSGIQSIRNGQAVSVQRSLDLS